MNAVHWRYCCLGLIAVALLALGRLAAEEALPLPKPLPDVQHPADNPATPEKVALGKALFFDPRLSRTDKVSCASCHDPAKGFSNGERVATGVDGQQGTRSAPSLINVGYYRSQFWDGRVGTLEEQALVPLQDAKEMDVRLDALVRKLNGIAD
jgi:cytochrome c peroxidase